MLVQLPVNTPVWSNVDEDNVTDYSATRKNVYLDDMGATVRRPGLVEMADLGTGSIDGIYYWPHKNKAYIVSNSNLYSMDEAGNITTIETGLFEVGNRVVWGQAIYPTRKIFGTNKGKMVEYDGVTAQQFTDANFPTKVSHLGVIDTYLVCNEVNTGQMHHSTVGQPTVSTGEYITAESNPDNIQALGIGWQEIILLGERSCEFAYNDGSTPFVPLDGANIEYGTPAPYSLILVDNSWFYLSHERRIVRLNGRQPQALSVPVDRIISGLTSVSDCIADHLIIGGRTFILFTFPSADKTLVFDYARQRWCGEWTYWDVMTATNKRFRANVIHYVDRWNTHLVGDYVNGKIYKFDTDTYQDDGDAIRSVWRTGHITHKTGNPKVSNEIRARLKRGKGPVGSTEPVLNVRWRDDGKDAWSNYRELKLGYSGDSNFFKSTYCLGQYTSRQYEFSISDNVPLSLVDVWEDVEVVNV